MTETAVLGLFVFLSLALGLAALVLALKSKRAVAEVPFNLRQGLDRDLEQLGNAIKAADPGAVQGKLEEFEVGLVARIQKVERAFIQLGEEVTEALDKAQTLDRSASAKRSRAKQLVRQVEQQEQEKPQTRGDWWQDPNLSRDEKLDRARLDLRTRGIEV